MDRRPKQNNVGKRFQMIGQCERCGRITAMHFHHMLMGSKHRLLADEDGLIIRLCPACHEAAHKDKELQKTIKQMAQKKYEKKHSREEWMKRYGRNYL